jgi:signal transduction histidine kinase
MFPAFYYSALALSLAVSAYVALLAWRHRKSRGAPAMLALAAATLVWTLGFLFESRSTSLTEQLFFNNLGYIGAMSVPAIWFIFTVQYTFHKLTSWKSIAPLFIVPVFIAALVWTNESHHLMWSNEHLVTAGTFLVTAKTYGPMFWVAYSYNYAMVLLGTYLLVRRVVVGAPLFAGQAVSLIIAAGLPVVWNIIYVFDLWNLPRKDLTPAMFAFSGLAVILGVLRFRLLTVVPFARQFVVEQLRDGIMAFDTHGRILEVNSAALTATGLSLEAVGKDIGSVSGLSPVFPAIYPFKNGRIELPVAVSGENRFFELETTAMKDSCERLKGWLVVLRDVTERKQMQQQLIMQDRLASIGQLVSGVAHELNNPLTSVIGFSNLILDKNIPVEFREDLIIVRDEAQRTADIVSSLLVFARGQENT